MIYTDKLDNSQKENKIRHLRQLNEKQKRRNNFANVDGNLVKSRRSSQSFTGFQFWLEARLLGEHLAYIVLCKQQKNTCVYCYG